MTEKKNLRTRLFKLLIISSKSKPVDNIQKRYYNITGGLSMDGVIYKITNLVNNKIYIGKTVNLAQRWASHRRIAKQWEYDEQTHHKHKYRSFLYAGWCASVSF